MKKGKAATRRSPSSFRISSEVTLITITKKSSTNYTLLTRYSPKSNNFLPRINTGILKILSHWTAYEAHFNETYRQSINRTKISKKQNIKLSFPFKVLKSKIPVNITVDQ